MSRKKGRRDDDRLNGDGALLTCKGIDMAYGPVQILFNVDFTVRENEIVALLGTNGAGKSTLLKGICGLVQAHRGHGGVRGRGRHLADGRRHDPPRHLADARRQGRVPDAERHREPAPGGVDDPRRSSSGSRRRVRRCRRCSRSSSARQSQLAGDLSGGEQQMLALGAALMTRPRLLMIDELSLGLAPTIVAQLLEVVKEIHARGTTIVLVEQSVNVALNLAERAVFMEKGEVRFEGPTSDLLERPDVLRSVFIAGANAADPRRARATGERRQGERRRKRVSRRARTRRSCSKPSALNKRFGGITAVDDVDLQLREGEILGLIGHNGAGKTTLMDCISGFNVIDGGRVFLQGEDITEAAPHERALGGLGRSFQDALLFPSLNVAETISVALERHLESKDLIAAAFQLPASYESEIDVGREGRGAHRTDGPRRVPREADR